MCERLCFHLQVDLSIDMSGIQGDVSQPSPNGIDVYAGTKHMDGARMPYTMWADWLLRERR